MTKVIILDPANGNVAIVSIVDKLLAEHNGDIESILINEYEFYNPEIDWMKLDLDEFGNFDVYQNTLYERESEI